MAKKRIVTQDLLSRISHVETVISKWMREKGTREIDPEGCMSLLVDSRIYNYDSKGKAHYFREDLRTLRDCNQLNTFSKLIIEQAAPGSKWYIRTID